MTTLRIAVAGAGIIGLRHIEEIGRCDGACLASIIDPSPGAVETARREGVALYPSLQLCLERDRPDGVVLATPNSLHVEQALACVDAGIPVLVEKPIGHTVESVERLVAEAERVGARLLVGHHRLHSPILHEAVAVVRSGRLGSIVGVIGSAVFYKPVGYHDGPYAWRREPGGGPILINMIHEIGNLRAMIGEIVSVQAMASNAIRKFPVEDTVAIGLRFANGALGSFLLSDTGASPKSWEQTSGEDVAFAHDPDEDAYVIVGTDGSLAVPTMRLKLYGRKEDRSWRIPFVNERIALERADPLARQIEHFVAVIRGDEEPLVSGRDGLQNLRVVEAIATAAGSGGTVEISV